MVRDSIKNVKINEPMTTKSRPFRYCRIVEQNGSILLSKIAYSSAKSPRKAITLTFIFTLVCCCGFGLIKVKSRGDELWVDQNSRPKEDSYWKDKVFGKQQRQSSFLFSFKNPKIEKNIFTVDSISEVLNVWDKIKAVKTSKEFTIGGLTKQWTYADLCAKHSNGSCWSEGVHRLFGGSFEAYSKSSFSSNDLATQKQASVAFYPDTGGTEPVQQKRIMANFTVDKNTGGVASNGLRVIIRLQGEIENSDAVLMNLESELRNTFVNSDTQLVIQSPYKYIRLDISLFRSIDDELARGVSLDIHLFVAAIIIMVIFAQINLGKVCEKINGRVALASSSVFMVTLAMLAGYGTSMILQVPFTQLTAILPFVLIAIGVDDSFVVTNAFDNTLLKQPVEERIKKAYHRCGMSITMTSLTDVVAFFLGMTTTLPAIRYFCVYAAFSIVYIYVFHLVCFPAMIAIDESRKQNQRFDCICCFKNHVKITNSGDAEPIEQQQNENRPNTPNKISERKASRTRKFMKLYSHFLMKPVVKIIVIISFVGMISLAAYGVSNVTTGFELIDLTPDKSYVRDMINTSDPLFGKLASNVPFGIYYKDIDYENAAVQAEMSRVSEDVLKLSFVWADAGVDDWHSAFTIWALKNPAYSANIETVGTKNFVTGKTFTTAVKAFLKEPLYERFKSNIIFSPKDCTTTCTITASQAFAYHIRFHYFVCLMFFSYEILYLITKILYYFFTIHVSLETSDEQVDAMIQTQEFVDKSSLGNKVLIYTYPYAFFDQFRIIRKELYTNFALCLTAVVLISTVILSDPVLILLVGLVMGMIDVCLVGMLPLWNLELNSITAINLVMAIGIVVDYSAHIVHCYTLQDHSISRNERVINTMVEIGPSVLLGVETSFLGIMPCILASSNVFRTFFKMFVSIIILGALFGLVLFPVLLSLIGPTMNNGEKEAPNDNTSIKNKEPRSIEVKENDVDIA